MAKTNGKRSKKTRSLKEGQKAQLTIAPDYSGEFPTFYANYVQVSHTVSEVFLDCCLLALPYNIDLDKNKVTTPVVARVVIPPKIMTGLIKALEVQAKKQEAAAKSENLALPISS
jgi:hypothetical protein